MVSELTLDTKFFRKNLKQGRAPYGRHKKG
jgi:hypothetical protein